MSAEALAEELLHPDGETRVARRGGERRVARLARLGRSAGEVAREVVRGDRSYLVTGGLGGIGLEVAGWLAERGAGAIVLNGRRAPDAGAAAAVEKLRERGVEVRVEIADMTDGAAVDDLLLRVDAEEPPLGGVIHSVGALSDAALVNQDWRRFEEVLWPKVLGAWRLHRATLDRELDLFVLFSSVTGVVGNAGQANHAAANAFLDQLARHRRALGLPGQAIAWGAWSEIGEAEEQRERMGERLDASGGWMTPEQGLSAFTRLVQEDVVTSVAVSVDWSLVSSGPPLLEELIEPGGESAAEEAGDLPRRLRELPPAEREGALIRFVQEELVSVLRLRAAPAADAGFFELGMDSLMAVELRNRLNRALGGAVVLSNTAVLDHPDVARLGAHLAREFGDAGPAEGLVRAPVPLGLREEERVAIVGMACRFPAGPDVGAFLGVAAFGSGRGDGGASGRALFVDAETGAARSFGGVCGGAGPLRRGVFPDCAGGGGAVGPAAAAAAGGELGGAGGRGTGPGEPPGEPDGGLWGRVRQRLPDAAGGIGRRQFEQPVSGDGGDGFDGGGSGRRSRWVLRVRRSRWTRRARRRWLRCTRRRRRCVWARRTWRWREE